MENGLCALAVFHVREGGKRIMSTHNYAGDREYVVCDHESWLVPEVGPDGRINAVFCWGHELQKEVAPPRAIPTVRAISPTGKRRCLKPAEGTAQFYLDDCDRENGVYRFICEKSGCYSLDAMGRYINGSFRENPAAVSATRYFQYAEAAMRVGGVGTRGPFAEPYLFPLRLESERLTDFHPGQSLWCRLWFAQEPLPLFDVAVSRRLPSGETATDELITDGDGYLTLPLTEPGDYLATVQKTTQEAAEHRYFDTSYAYTFWFRVEP